MSIPPSKDKTLFQEGNFCATAMATEDPFLKGASLVLIGNVEEGMTYLKPLQTYEATYYKAFGYWSLNQKEEALRLLKNSKEKKLNHLEELIQQPKIRALIQTRDNYTLRAMKNAPEFDVISIGHTVDSDIFLEPGETILSILKKLPKDWVPDFYLAHQLEFDIIPTEMDQAPFPIFAYSSDYDVQIHNCFHQLGIFDAIIVIDNVDHEEVSKGFGVKTLTFCKVIANISLEVAKMPVKSYHRQIDFYFSGNAFHADHDDKSRLLFRATQLSDSYNIKVLNSFLPPWKYMDEISRSKLSFTYVRRKGAFPSRALDALSRGTAVLYQEGGRLGLFFSENEGAIPYREDNLEQVIHQSLKQWEEKYSKAALKGREKIIRSFGAPMVMGQYLKFLALMASETPKAERPKKSVESQLRLPHHLNGLPLASSDYNIKICSENLSMLRQENRRKKEATLLNLEAVVNVIAYYYTKIHLKTERQELVTQALETLEEAIRLSPINITLLMNRARLLYHTGQEAESEKLFQQLISQNQFYFSPLENPFPTDFFPNFFPYRHYIDLLLRYLVSPSDLLKNNLIRLIQSSALFYLAQISWKKEQAEKTVSFLKQAVSQTDNVSSFHFFLSQALRKRYDERASSKDLEESLQHLLKSWALTPQNIHPQIVSLIQTCEMLNNETSNLTVLKYGEIWRRYLQAREDLSFNTIEFNGLDCYLNISSLVSLRQKRFKRVFGSLSLAKMNYLSAKVRADKTILFKYLLSRSRIYFLS